jgi:hypothetical protein
VRVGSALAIEQRIAKKVVVPADGLTSAKEQHDNLFGVDF